MKKLIPLQYIRGVAALSVLLTHVMQYLNIKPFGYFWSGQYGVDVFFILSGFIIYFTLKDNETFGRFMIKRIFRIYPLYLVCLFFYFINKILWGGEIYSIETIMQNILMFPYTREIGYRSLIIVQSWSLVFEMYFYCCMAITILLFKKKQYILPVLVINGIIGFTLKIINPMYLMEHGIFKYLISITTSPHIIKFLVGVAIAAIYLKNQHRIQTIDLRKFSYRLAFIFIQLIFIVMLVLKYNHFFALAGSIMFFLSYLFYDKVFEITYDSRISKIMSYLGDISYSIYMIHFLIIYIFLYQFHVNNFSILLVITLSLTIGLSMISYKYIEQPFIKLGRSLTNRYHYLLNE